MSPNCMPCHKAYFLDDEGNYTEIGEITDVDLTPQNDDKYDISCSAWDEMTITFKLSWWQRVKLWFLTRRKRKWTMKRSQELARGYGGTVTLDLEPGEKLIEITWKDADLWYLTRPFRDGEEAETYEFKESSNYGIWEGTVIIIEHK